MTLTDESIDRQSAVPYYQQMAHLLEQEITDGRIARGDRLPSENDLCVKYGLSRATVRQGLQHMESRGTAQRIPNRGYFAATPAEETGWVIQGKEGFLENALTHQNRAVSTTVLRAGTATLPEPVCQSLEIPTGTIGFELVRVRSLDGTPAVYSTNFSPPAVTPVLASATEVLAGQASLSELLAHAGFTLGGAARTVRALHPSPEIAKALEISTSHPVLCIRSTSWTPAGQRYDVYETWVRSDVIPLEVNVSTVDLGPTR